jgi:Dolichyl-phosphate-mannose-protein mannosyltransferase
VIGSSRSPSSTCQSPSPADPIVPAGQSRVVFTLAATLVAVIWLAARVAFFNGYYTEDAPGYVSDAVSLALGQYQARNHVNGLNVGTYLPVALPLRVMGKSEVALSLWPLFCSALGVASMAGTAALLFGWPIAALAALLYATYPGDVFFSTVVMPDAIQSGWLSFSIFLVTLACSGRADRVSRRLLAAGAAMGVCHLIRASGVILVPVAVAAVATLSLALPADGSRNPRRDVLARLARRCTLYLGGWLIVLASEGAAYWWAVDDFLFRFHVVDRHYGSVGSIQRFGLNTHRLTIPYSAFPPLLWMDFGGWGSLNQDQAYHGLLFTWAFAVLVLAAVVLALTPGSVPRRAKAGYAMAAIWFAWPLLFHQYGSQSLTQFVPIHRLSRHLVVYAPGAVFATVAGGYVIWTAACHRSWRAALSVATIGALLVHLQFNARGEAIAYASYHNIKDTYRRIRDRLPADTRLIVADPGDLGFFDFWLNPLGESRVTLHALARYPDCASLSAGVVLTYSNPGWEGLNAPVIQETVARLPCLLTPPSRWRLLYAGYPERIYAIE